MNKNKEYIKKIKLIGVIFFTILFALIGNGKVTNKTEYLNNIQNENIQETISIENNAINNIPKYSGQIVITINNDIPYFEDKDITIENFEDYSLLDKFDRAGVAFANICKYTMPKERYKKRKSFI